MDPDPLQAPKSPALRAQVQCDAAAYRVDEPRIQALAHAICAPLGVADHELAISFVESDAIQSLNRDFRGKDKPTDVLSFPQVEFASPLTLAQPAPAAKSRRRGPPPTLGDVVISLPEAEGNARGIGQPLAREVCFLLVHGVLHLCGHDHEEPAEEALMLAEQRALMDRIGDLWIGCVEAARGAH